MNKKNGTRCLLAALVSGSLLVSQGAMAVPFTNKIIKGSYATTIDGVFTFVEKNPVGLPAWFTGIVEADGKGNITSFKGTFNVGACLVVSHDGNGTYAVQPDGSASATVQITAAPISALNPQCSDSVMRILTTMPLMNTVKFSLAVQDSKNVYGSILSKTDPSGKLVGFGGSLTAHRQ
jgi:hypothetical protein